MPRVLVVDDEQTILQILQDLLEDEGYTVVTASNGREALAVLAKAGQVVDLVLTDVMMPYLNGWQLCQAIQTDPAFKHIPVVLMSAADKGNPNNSYKPVAFTKKPLEFEELLALIARFTSYHL